MSPYKDHTPERVKNMMDLIKEFELAREHPETHGERIRERVRLEDLTNVRSTVVSSCGVVTWKLLDKEGR